MGRTLKDKILETEEGQETLKGTKMISCPLPSAASDHHRLRLVLWASGMGQELEYPGPPAAKVGQFVVHLDPCQP